MSVRVIGNFVAEVDKVPPTITTIAFDNADEFRESTPTVRGFVVGQFLTDSELSLGTGGEGMTVEINGVPTNDRIDFILHPNKPVSPNHEIEFVVKKDKVKRKYTATVTYQARTPSISEVEPAEAYQGEGKVDVRITGEHFAIGATISTDGLEKIGEETVISSTEMKMTVKVTAETAVRSYGFAVTTSGGTSEPKTFAIMQK